VAKRKLFNAFDIVLWVLGTAILGLCIFAAIKAGPVPAKVVSVATGVVLFLGLGPVVYWIKAARKKADYVTKHGVRVLVGAKNSPSKEAVEMWTSQAMAHWHTKRKWGTEQDARSFTYRDSPYNPSIEDLLAAVFDATAIFHDEEKLSVLGRYVRGYSFGNDVAVGYRADLGYVETLFKHELSHVILFQAGVPLDEVVHHEIFTKTGAHLVLLRDQKD